MADNVRGEKLRSQVAAQRATAVSLQSRIKSPHMKQRLQTRVLDRLRDIEGMFLIHDEGRLPTQDEDWIDKAESLFQVAMQELVSVEKLVDTYGPDAKTIG
ncbi:MAG TPA: hypothetical protein VGX46_15775 [Vicinamibacterales bacterium]|jgi:hypothetical protein|nr:hypothetical protein [Vicinamibacterales bacterium]